MQEAPDPERDEDVIAALLEDSDWTTVNDDTIQTLILDRYPGVRNLSIALRGSSL